MTGEVAWHEECPGCGRTWVVEGDPSPRAVVCVCGEVFEMPTRDARREESVIDLSAYREGSHPVE